MTLDDILEAGAGVLSVAMFGMGTLWGIHNNPQDTAIALLILIMFGVFAYVTRDEWAKWQKEQIAKNRR